MATPQYPPLPGRADPCEYGGTRREKLPDFDSTRSPLAELAKRVGRSREALSRARSLPRSSSCGKSGMGDGSGIEDSGREGWISGDRSGRRTLPGDSSFGVVADRTLEWCFLEAPPSILRGKFSRSDRRHAVDSEKDSGNCPDPGLARVILPCLLPSSSASLLEAQPLRPCRSTALPSPVLLDWRYRATLAPLEASCAHSLSSPVCS